MAYSNCFCYPTKKKHKGGKDRPARNRKNLQTLDSTLGHAQESPETVELRSPSFNVGTLIGTSGSSRYNVKVMSHGSPVAVDSHELRMKKDNSNSDLQAQIIVGETSRPSSFDMDIEEDNLQDNKQHSNIEDGLDVTSDPGSVQAKFWASPILKRSCSNPAMASIYGELEDQLPPSKAKSYRDLQRLAEKDGKNGYVHDAASPVSVRSHCSADKVILKKHSSMQILPSGSRRLWWKFFLWSHRNLYKPQPAEPQPVKAKPSGLNQLGGYYSDTVEPRGSGDSSKRTSPSDVSMAQRKWNGSYGASGRWPENQWIAIPAISSPFTRVDEWVKEACTLTQDGMANAEEDGGITSPPSPGNNTSSTKGSSHLTRNPPPSMPEELSHANSFVLSLNSSSNVAHISGVGLKAIPSISHFLSLRTVNLSGNLIVNIAPASLPKGLHVLDLSRNKIQTIEGLRELTRLRVLNLSYNRISRISGLSNCTMIKELHLVGNKISVVEGLHRLLKLTVLDLSFNKITTAKALGQLVANYHSLIALNLLGNPVQVNISDDQLRKTVCSFLPKLALLNKQPVNPQKAREIREDANAKAVLGNSSLSNKLRKGGKRVQSQGSSSSYIMLRNAQKTKQRSKSRAQHHSLSSTRNGLESS